MPTVRPHIWSVPRFSSAGKTDDLISMKTRKFVWFPWNRAAAVFCFVYGMYKTVQRPKASAFQRWLKNNNQFERQSVLVITMHTVLFSEIAFIFHQIYPKSRSHARFAMVAKPMHSKNIHCKWSHPMGTKKKESSSNIQITIQIFDLFRFHFVIFVRDLVNPVLTTFSSTSHLKRHQSGIGMAVHFFFSRRTHHAHCSMGECEALLNQKCIVENLSLCCTHKRTL